MKTEHKLCFLKKICIMKDMDRKYSKKNHYKNSGLNRLTL
jgi:hypothetical protein